MTCWQGGYVWIYPTKDQFTVRGSENLSYYVYGTRVAGMAKCKTCGVQVYIDLKPLTDEMIAELPEEFRKDPSVLNNTRLFNLRVLNGLDLKRVKAARHDGWNMLKPAYVNP